MAVIVSSGPMSSATLRRRKVTQPVNDEVLGRMSVRKTYLFARSCLTDESTSSSSHSSSGSSVSSDLCQIHSSLVHRRLKCSHSADERAPHTGTDTNNGHSGVECTG